MVFLGFVLKVPRVHCTKSPEDRPDPYPRCYAVDMSGIAAIAAVAGAGIGAGSVLAYGVAGRSSQIFGESVYKGPGRRRVLALTFDDGPSESTPELLDFLAEQGVPATFFQCGLNVLRHPGIARRVRDEGHEIGNHTFSHPCLGPDLRHRPIFKSRSFIYEEFAKAQDAIASEVGLWPTLMRAPYGLRWFGVAETQQRLGLLGVMWTVIGHDWEWNTEQVAALVLARARPGGIICLHDGRDIQKNPDISIMMTAVRHLVPALRAKGYGFETVSEILEPDFEQTNPT